MLISWGSWTYKRQFSILQTRTEIIDSLQSAQTTNQEKLEDMQRVNDSITDRLREAERQTHDLQKEMERTQGKYYRAIHEMNPLYNSYGHDNSAESQRY